jgi:RHS repeat-associated protein
VDHGIRAMEDPALVKRLRDERVALTVCPWRWPGQYEDEETGLFYNRFRYYDPAAGTGLGFVFEGYDPWHLFAAVVRAAQSFRHRADWSHLVENGMREDVSWTRSARR